VLGEAEPDAWLALGEPDAALRGGGETGAADKPVVEVGPEAGLKVGLDVGDVARAAGVDEG
jgi:hypothetical protein